MPDWQAFISNYNDGKDCYDFVTNIHNNDYSCFKYFEMNENVDSIQLFVSCQHNTGIIEVWLDNFDGNPLCIINVNKTDGQNNFERVVSKFDYPVIGRHEVIFRYKSRYQGKIMNCKSFQFFKFIILLFLYFNNLFICFSF